VYEQAKVIATAFALCGFAVSVVSGLIAGETAVVAILRAILAMLVCYCVGWLGATCMFHAIREHLERYVTDRPIPPIAAAAQHVDNYVDYNETLTAPLPIATAVAAVARANQQSVGVDS